jgi:hypothetical protein
MFLRVFTRRLELEFATGERNQNPRASSTVRECPSQGPRDRSDIWAQRLVNAKDS